MIKDLLFSISLGQKWRNDNRCGSKTNPDGEFHTFRTRPGGPIAECNPHGKGYKV